ncbi:hypothetical protein BofuT4_uP000720.1 [Botrytis cinerea T4]|uniref:Uncharacterized protein n=1 Tax=Botryotinia fuckeliana (strain T4) TaxID=999810 RepID=G2YLX7_BOTF4|nr:hypothetical protein BofuT4_uP000720.1 [Botrytis cinerea T4]
MREEYTHSKLVAPPQFKKYFFGVFVSFIKVDMSFGALFQAATRLWIFRDISRRGGYLFGISDN